MDLEQHSRCDEPEFLLGASHLPSCQTGKSGATILLVEDEDYVREVTRQVLEGAGFRVVEARTASEAKEVFRGEADKPELLITDVVLPDQNGRRLSQELTGLDSGLKTIYVSGYPENVVTLARGQDSMFYLAKPFSQESLLGMVRHVLKQECPAEV